MDAGIVTAIITGILSLVGVIVTNMMSNNKMQSQMQIAQAITDTKITQLTDAVNKHNSFATKIPVLENEIQNLKNDISALKKNN